MDDRHRLEQGLLAIRLSTALFLLPWILAKFLAPDAAAGIFAKYYWIEGLPALGSYAVGTFQVVVWALFVAGAARTWSYGIVLGMHGLSTLSTWRQLLTPAEGHHMLFFAAIPVVAALWLLFLMREHDGLWSLGGRRGAAA